MTTAPRTLPRTVPAALRAWPDLPAPDPGTARRPWRWVRDELRLLDDDVMLGLTFTDLPGLRRAGLPFLLTRQR